MTAEQEVIFFKNNNTKNQEEEDFNLGLSINMDFFKDSIDQYVEPIPSTTTEEKKKRGRKKKDDPSTMVPPKGSKVEPINQYIESNAQYINSYDETNNMLKSSIAQIDGLNGIINDQLSQIIASKTLKKKYDYISELTGTIGSIVGTKVSAVREINKSITDSHRLEIQRIKDLKLSQSNEMDDDRRIQEMYNAFISTPTNMSIGPTMSDLNLGGGGYVPAAASREDAGYSSWLANMTPEQNRMMIEDSGVGETVLIYDPMTGARRFEVIDKNTGQPIPNVPVPSDIILENTNIDTRTGLARNRDINTTYRIIVVGQNSPLDHL